MSTGNDPLEIGKIAADWHQSKGLGLELPVGMTTGTDQGSRDQLSLIGAAFVAGMKSGSGNFEITSPVCEPESKAESCVHKIPSIRLLLDGKRAAPEAVKDFDGKPLYYILDEIAQNGDSLQVFSDQIKAMKHLAELSKGEQTSGSAKANKARTINLNTGSTRQEIADAIGGAVFLWEHINFSGNQWRFGVGTTSGTNFGHSPGDGNIPDFRRVFPTLWWSQNINDKVSSVWNASEVWAYLRPRKSYAILHQHVNFQGSQLWVPQRASFPDLRQYGWNDVASSLSYALSM